MHSAGRRALFTAYSLAFIGFLQAGAWGKSGLWDDGRAEVAIYESERIIDGKSRKFREQLIVQREDLRLDTLVKAVEPKKQKNVRVLKLNQVQRIDSDNYPHTYLASVFVKDDPIQQVVKVSVGSQEWSGNVFKMLTVSTDGATGRLSWHSYIDGEADQAVEFTLQKDDYFEDQLPLSLRALPFKEGYQSKIRVWGSLISNHAMMPSMQEAQLKVELEEPVRSRAGTLPSWKVVIEGPAGKDIYWFEKAEPHVLTKMETHDGRKRVLYGRARWNYSDSRLPMPNILK